VRVLVRGPPAARHHQQPRLVPPVSRNRRDAVWWEKVVEFSGSQVCRNLLYKY